MSDRRHTIFLEVKTKGTPDAKSQAEALDKVATSAKTAQRSLAEIDRERYQAERTRRTGLADLDRERYQSQERVRNALADADRMEFQAQRRQRWETMGRSSSGDVPRIGRVGGPESLAGNLPPALGRIFGAVVAGHVVSAGFEAYRDSEAETAGGVIRDTIGAMVKSVPLVGDLARGFGALEDVLTGAAKATRDHAKAMDLYNTATTERRAISEIHAGALADRMSLGQRFADFGLDAARMRLSAGFRQQFVGNDPTGSGPAIADATAGHATAGIALMRDQLVLASSQFGQTRSAELDRKIAQQERAVKSTQFRGTRRTPIDPSREGALDAMLKDQRTYLAEIDKLIDLRTDKERHLTSIRKQQEQVAKSEVDYMKQGVEAVRARSAAELDRAKFQKEQASSVAERLGGARPGEAQEARRILEQIDLGGIDSVSPEEAELGERFSPQSVRRARIRAGQQNPDAQFFLGREAGAIGNIGGSGIVADWEQKVAALETMLNTKVGEATTKIGTALGNALERLGEESAKTVKQAEDNAVAKAQRQRERENQANLIQRQTGQQ